MVRAAGAWAVAMVACAGAVRAGGTINSGDASFQIGFTNAIGSFAYPFNAPNGEGMFKTDAAGAGGIDHIYKNIWWYRAGSVTGVRIMSSINNPVEAYGGNRGFVTYPNFFTAGGLPGADIFFDIKVRDGSVADRAVVYQVVTIVNRSATQPLSIQLFNQVEFDIGGADSAGDDTVNFVGGSPTYQRTTDSSGRYGEFRAVGAALGRAGTSVQIKALFPTSSANQGMILNLDNTGDGSGGDAAGVAQWSLNIPAGGSQQILSVIALNQTAPASLPCRLDYNEDGGTDSDDLGDFITDYFAPAHLPGPMGYASHCPGNTAPYNAGYKTAFTLDGSAQCFAPNPDNLGDYITSYFQGC